MPSLKELQEKHIAFELDSLDRLLFKVSIPLFNTSGGTASFLRNRLGYSIPHIAQFKPFRDHFISSIEEFSQQLGLGKIEHFPKEAKNGGKEQIVRKHLQELEGKGELPEVEGVIYIGKAQEKTYVHESKWKDGLCSISWAHKMVNWYYIYFIDKDFGLCFLRICSYAPFSIFFYCNGHEYTKRRLEQEGIGFEALDNGLKSCENAEAAQKIANELQSVSRIEKVIKKWLSRVPNPNRHLTQYYGLNRAIGVHQMEYAKTQIWDNARHGRAFHEQTIRENIGLGMADKTGVIFGKQTQRKNSRKREYKSRILHYGAIAVFTIFFGANKLKQYLKEAQGTRTEATTNNPHDFGIGKTLTHENWTKLWAQSRGAVERTLEIQKLSHDPSIGMEALEKLERPVEKNGQRVGAMPRGNKKTEEQYRVLASLDLKMGIFQNRDIKSLLACLQGKKENEITSSSISYMLKKLKMHEIIEKEEGKNQYKLTEEGRHVVNYVVRAERILKEGLGGLLSEELPEDKDVKKLRKAEREFMKASEEYFRERQIAA